MGFGDRLRLGLSKILSSVSNSPQPLAYTATPKLTTNINVNRVREHLGGFSQPVFGPEISTVGAYSREGYTSRTFDSPIVKFADQVYYVERDEDIQRSLQILSSMVTGGEHYWKSEMESVQDHMTQFSTDIDFDWIDQLIVKDLLPYGNSFWKPRLGIANIRNRDDLMQIPISSAVRIWWDRTRRPYKYEFRGSQWQGFHNPEDIIHLSWNPVDGSLFGNGFMTVLASIREFWDQTPTGDRRKELASLMDRKYSMAMLTHLSARRYSPHNVFSIEGGSNDERTQLKNDLADWETGEDVVAGKKVNVTELGSSARAYNPEQFMDTVLGPVFKATGDFSGKQGTESSHQYANAETAARLDELGLASFPLAVSRQLVEKIFQPWYEVTGGVIDPMYGGGIVSIPWKEANPVLNFGRVQKKDIDPEMQIKLLEIGIQSGSIRDPVEIRELLEDAGLGLRQQYTDQINTQYNDPGVMPPGFAQQQQPGQQQQQPSFDTHQADYADRPMDDPNYTVGNKDFEPAIQSMDATYGQTNQCINPQPSDPRLTFTSTGNTGSISKKKFNDTFDKLELDDINAWYQNSGNRETSNLDSEERQENLKEKKLKNQIRENILTTLQKFEGKE